MTNKQIKALMTALIIFVGLLLWSASNAQSWEHVGKGIDKMVIYNKIQIFKIDQEQYKFRAVGSNTNPKVLPTWTEDRAGGINLNMFVVGNLPRGYAKFNGRVIQPEFKSDYNAFIVWDDTRLTIMDRQRDSMEEILSYSNVSQNIRMMWSKDKDKNRWQKNNKKWSVSALATTADGCILLIHSRAPFTMFDFNNALLNYTKYLKIDMLVYLEGGPESGLVVHGDKESFKLIGSYETGFNENSNNTTFWPIPWALTFKKR